MPAYRSKACALLAGSLVLPLAAQDLRTLDRSLLLSAAYDRARGRTIAVGLHGETFEFDGSRWRNTPAPALATVLPRQLAYDPVGQRTYAVAPDGAGTVVWTHDGTGWRDVATGPGPALRGRFTLAYDAIRSELVLFGGAYLASPAFGDTWVFDGAQWQQRQPAATPPARFDAAMTYDEIRGRVVLFGGFNYSNGFLSDTWEWDGSTWASLATSNPPTARSWAALAHDPGRQRIVLFGGSSGAGTFADVWEFDGQNWQAVTPAPGPAPSARSLANMVYDAGRGECLLTGGQGSGDELDTWTWNGQRWLLLDDPNQGRHIAEPLLAHPNTTDLLRLTRSTNGSETRVFDGTLWTTLPISSPPIAFGAALATGPANGYVFGGTGLGGVLSNDLHRFDGASWTTVSPGAGGPAPRTGAAMAFDWTRQHLVMFGGLIQPASTAVNGETWTFDGTTWSQVQTSSSPVPRSRHTMAFDPLSNRTVVYGGVDGTANPLHDTWAFDGATWSPVAPNAPAPGNVIDSPMAWDASRGAVTLISGPQPYGSNGPLQAWTLDANGWTARPLGRTTMAWPMVPDSVVGFPYSRGLALTSSTMDPYGVFGLSDAGASVESYGTACSASAPTVHANYWPQLGTGDFAIEVQRAPANAFALLLGATASANLPVLSCTQLVLPGQAAALLPTTPGGLAALPLPIPNGITFVGLDLFFQAATLDASTQHGFTLSHGLRVRIGD